MKAEVLVWKEVEIQDIWIEIAPLYIGDSEDDDMPTDFPHLNDEKTLWIASVNIDTGMIYGWPIGEERRMHVKVCDAGVYTLVDIGQNVIKKHAGYVPDIVPGEYGDYVIMTIDSNGYIQEWDASKGVADFFNDD